MQLSVVSTAVRFSYCKYKSYTCTAVRFSYCKYKSYTCTAVRFSYCKYKSYTCSDTVTEKVASGLCIFLQDISRMSAINLIKCDMVATIFWQCMQVEPHTKR